MLKVVISHSRKDVEFAEQMTVELQKATWISGSTGRHPAHRGLVDGNRKRDQKGWDVPDITMEEATLNLP